MANIRRPLKINNVNDGTLQTMSDSELETISLQLRMWYARRLFTSLSATSGNSVYPTTGPSTGSKVFVPGMVVAQRGSEYYQFKQQSSSGRNFHQLGALSDTYRPGQVTTQVDDDNTTPDPDIPAAPSVETWRAGETVRSTYRWSQCFPKSGVNLYPDSKMLDTFSYMISRGGSDIGPEGNTSYIVDTIIKHSVNEMVSGDEIGTYRVSSTSPGDGWAKSQNFPDAYFWQDSYSTVSGPFEHMNNHNTFSYYLYLKIGNSTQHSYNYNTGSGYNRSKNHLIYSNYKGAMQSGSAIVSPDDDFFIEGTYKGTIYVKATNKYGASAWSTDNSTYTNSTYTADSTPYFDLDHDFSPQIRTPLIYPTGSSSDGYIRIYAGVAPEKTIGRVPSTTNSAFGMGLGDSTDYNTSNIYKFTYEPGVREGYHPIISEINALGLSADHDPIEQGRHRRLSLYAYVLLPCLEAFNSNGIPNFPYYLVLDSPESTSSTFKRRRRGTITNTVKLNSATSSAMGYGSAAGTYYSVRYGTGTSTATSTRYLLCNGYIR